MSKTIDGLIYDLKVQLDSVLYDLKWHHDKVKYYDAKQGEINDTIKLLNSLRDKGNKE